MAGAVNCVLLTFFRLIKGHLTGWRGNGIDHAMGHTSSEHQASCGWTVDLLSISNFTFQPTIKAIMLFRVRPLFWLFVHFVGGVESIIVVVVLLASAGGADHPLRLRLLRIHEQCCTSLSSLLLRGGWGGHWAVVRKKRAAHEKLDQFLHRMLRIPVVGSEVWNSLLTNMWSW